MAANDHEAVALSARERDDSKEPSSPSAAPSALRKAEAVPLDSIALKSLSNSAFLLYLAELGVELRGADGKLQLNAPAGALTESLKDELRHRKPELLVHLATLREDNTERVAPLTFAQQRLWLLDRISPHSITYNIPQSWVIEDHLDTHALQVALRKLIQRHSALRTAIEVRGGEPIQVVKKHVNLTLEITSFNDELDSSTADIKARALLIEEGRKPFSLSHAPLIRFHAIHVRERKWIFSYCVHHIIADQWSLEVLKRELTALYIEAVSGRQASLPDLVTTYGDFAVREKNGASRSLHHQQLEYWRTRLLGAPTILELPFAAPRAAKLNDLGATLQTTINAATTLKLRELATRRQTSLYMLMLALFEVLLFRYTGQTDMCIGTPITGRKMREDESLIGMFVNMLPLRLSLNPGHPFDQLLRQVNDAVLTDFENGDIPFQRIVNEIDTSRSTSYSPVFQFLFALNPMASQGAGSQQETFIGISKYDLSLQIAERPETLDVFLEYKTELYAAEDIQQFSQHFVELASSVASSPELPIYSLNLSTVEDLRSAKLWNQTELPYDRSATLASLLQRQFEKQLQRNPDAIAVFSQQGSQTYLELHEQSLSLASRLQARGLGPGDYVAVCLDRTPELIVALVAILLTGAAYLPLDANYPEDRLTYMLSDSGASLLITKRNALGASVSANSPILQKLYLDEDLSEVVSHPNASHRFVPQTIKSEDAAYLIYTSGSTGQPKGVIVEHGNVVSLMAWAQHYFEPELLRGLLASTSICFDLSIFEIFLPLITGNAIILVNDVLELSRSEHAGRVTLVNTVPSAMSALLQDGLPAGVQAVCLAGEFLSSELVDRIYATGIPRVFDLYGPTETTTYSTCTLRAPGTAATIGRPIANTRVYLLNSYRHEPPDALSNSVECESFFEPPLGAIGELFISGAGVTRGYLNRPELTSERYLTLPSVESQGRLYRTGDLARRRRDGQIVYMGRRDQQVKLRGHRIELGEIEAALRVVTHATEVAVILWRNEAGETLIAFVAESKSLPSTPASWQATLRERLPSFMLPSQIIVLDSMPRTPNGKIDRTALAQSAQSSLNCAPSFSPPHNVLEQWIANIWARRLGLKHVARDRHFFEDIGGHSLAAFEIFVEIERKIGVEMMLATLFQTPTVASLTAAVERLPHRLPESIGFVQPGTSDVVVYRFPEASSHLQSLAQPEEVDNRIMRLLALEDSPVERWAREIIAFETALPTLQLAVSSEEASQAEQLADRLARAGFERIQVLVTSP
jgi:amino acid adenylation domain-containing protein